ncbi:MAG: flagellar biosynthetic protein FliO [Ignavibacteria bacterium]|jgi:flagellar protein FliO/FliZ|nr:flagellar biosynthetic protein FliO [Ignavibacteria bacterium]MCU7503752.1 flagellar biosynthetic protein FliO [Ignavibacteria bacterium]MCU7517234.1 flagellar biosynthetic protein FliO [Ignavibacteria bacterium]
MEFWNILKVIFLLIFILGLMYGTLYLARKYFFTFDKNSKKLVKIKVLSTQMLMPKKFIQVVQVHDKILVLGVSDHSINLLQEINGSVAARMVEEETVREDLRNNLKDNFKDNFVEILKKNLGLR